MSGIRIMDLLTLTMVQRCGWSCFGAKTSLEVLLSMKGDGARAAGSVVA